MPRKPSDHKRVEQVEVTEKQWNQFLDLLRQNPQLGHVTALRQVGVEGTRGQLNAWLNDPEHDRDEEIAEAKGYSHNDIRLALRKLGIDGVDEPVFQGGQQVGTKRVYAVAALNKLADMRLPEAKNQRAVDITTGGEPLTAEDRSASLAEVHELLKQVGAVPAE